MLEQKQIDEIQKMIKERATGEITDGYMKLISIYHADNTEMTMDKDEEEQEYSLLGGIGQTKISLNDEFEFGSIEIAIEAIPSLIEWLQKVNEEINKET